MCGPFTFYEKIYQYIKYFLYICNVSKNIMYREDIIYKLKELISDYEYEKRVLTDMIDSWNNHDDPESDPGLQYEQEYIVDNAYNAIVEFTKKNM